MPRQTPGPNQRHPRALARVRDLLSTPGPDLGWSHDLGTALSALRVAGPDGPQPVRAVAEQAGLDRIKVHQLMKFGDAFRRREVAGLAVPWGSVVYLLSVRDPSERLRLLRAAAAERWPQGRVRREVHLTQPPRGRGIRGRRVPAGLDEFWRFVEVSKDLADRFALWEARLPGPERARLLLTFLPAKGDDTAAPDPEGRRREARLREAYHALCRSCVIHQTLSTDLQRILGAGGTGPGDPAEAAPGRPKKGQ